MKRRVTFSQLRQNVACLASSVAPHMQAGAVVLRTHKCVDTADRVIHSIFCMDTADRAIHSIFSRPRHVQQSHVWLFFHFSFPRKDKDNLSLHCR